MATSRSFDIGGGAVLNVSCFGSQGPALIFLHFWGGSSRTYSPVIELLGTHFQTFAVDFRGWGASTGPDDPDAYSIQTLADDIEAVITALQLKSYFIIGHSMGGKVAQLLAGKGCLKGLQGVVLVAPAPPSPLELPAEAKEQQLSAYDSRENATFVAKNVLTSTSLPDGVIAALAEDMLKGSSVARDAWPKYAMAEDVTAEVQNITVPVLVVAASADRVEPADKMQSLVVDRIKHASLVVIEGSGHMIPVEAPGQLATHIKSFVDKVSI
ncbi:hypothetical protein BP6252_13843 [Coleophoma cylindrospora]|uniref:AB hydrolase-1 domain-containing protein n=1 Tax=Coleophoma cylindrospora TaxID=1849047 RepID=A0A3D8Q5Y8_9HELO|nr:hypothetical protein BP6252_13843 [Coleophoma cylindrospora]